MRDYVIFAVYDRDGLYVPNVALKTAPAVYAPIRTGLKPCCTEEEALAWARQHVRNVNGNILSEKHPYPDMNPKEFTYEIRVENDGYQFFVVMWKGEPFARMASPTMPSTPNEATYWMRYAFSSMLEGLEQWGCHVDDVTSADVRLVVSAGAQAAVYDDLLTAIPRKPIRLH